MLLEAVGIGKSFPPSTQALDGVDFQLRAGEVHALVGENGAGKSTLSAILAGIHQPDTGRLALNGAAFAPQHRREGEAAGIRIVLQELNLIDTLSVGESVLFDRLPHRWGWISQGRLRSLATEALSWVGLESLDPSLRVASLSVGHRQLVEIAAGLAAKASVLILDEPTAALTETEAESLFRQIARLKRQGVGIIYISHRMEEVLRIADRVTVLRDGHRVAERDTTDLGIQELIHLMVGRTLESQAPRPVRVENVAALRVEHLSVGDRVRDVSFTLHAGEILGFAGLMGAGRTETMRAVFGADRPTEGRIFMGNDPEPLAIRSPHDAIAAGIAMVTEDRKHEGLLMPWSIQRNIGLLRLPSLSNAWGWIRGQDEAALGERQRASLEIQCSSLDQSVRELSGGNQQKVVIAKWLSGESQVLIFDEPTRGIDIGAKFEIYQLLEKLAAEGKSILVVSSELAELLHLCDRIAVMSRGQLVRTFERHEFGRKQILSAALSRHLSAEKSAALEAQP